MHATHFGRLAVRLDLFVPLVGSVPPAIAVIDERKAEEAVPCDQMTEQKQCNQLLGVREVRGVNRQEALQQTLQ